MSGVFEQWSDAILHNACVDACGIDREMLMMSILWRGLREALEDPKNWKRVRIRRDATTRRQAARVVRALRHAKPGQLVYL